MFLQWQTGKKNITGILNAIAQLAKSTINFHVDFIGPSDEVPEYIALSRNLQIEAYTSFSGFMLPEEVAERMQESDCFLMFSRYEGLPCVILEAMCCGLPIIATNIDGIPQVVDDNRGILVPSEDETDLAGAMSKLISAEITFDHNSISSYATQAFSKEKVGELLQEQYDEILS